MKPRKNVTNQPAATPQRKVRILKAACFGPTLERYKHDSRVLTAFRAFIALKRDNPMAPYGSKDYPFKGNGKLRGFGRAGLTFDVSIVYTIEGRDPTTIKLLGLFSHDELGTGQPAAMKRQDRAAAMFSSQTQFTPFETIDESHRNGNTLIRELLRL